MFINTIGCFIVKLFIRCEQANCLSVETCFVPAYYTVLYCLWYQSLSLLVCLCFWKEQPRNKHLRLVMKLQRLSLPPTLNPSNWNLRRFVKCFISGVSKSMLYFYLSVRVLLSHIIIYYRYSNFVCLHFCVFGQVYLPCVLQTKKRYVGYMYESLDQKNPVFDAKGIETVRRDGCPAVAKVTSIPELFFSFCPLPW